MTEVAHFEHLRRVYHENRLLRIFKVEHVVNLMNNLKIKVILYSYREFATRLTLFPLSSNASLTHSVQENTRQRQPAAPERRGRTIRAQGRRQRRKNRLSSRSRDTYSNEDAGVPRSLQPLRANHLLRVQGESSASQPCSPLTSLCRCTL
jgi:hypothetical protein